MYQCIVHAIRRHEIAGGYGWPGSVPWLPESRYPNIAAELYSSGLWLQYMAEFARVSPEVMASVIEEGEELSAPELFNLSLKWESRGPGYLSSPSLQMVDPSTNKGKRRRRELQDLLKQADGLNFFHDSFARNVCTLLEQGKPISFAQWWWASYYANEALKEQAEAQYFELRSQQIRTERRVTA